MFEVCGCHSVTFLIGHLYLIGVRLGETKKNINHKDTCLKEIGICLQISLTTPHSTMITIGKICAFGQ